MLRPTYEEQFSVPEEYMVDAKKTLDIRYDASTADNTSIGSLKDSGYRYVCVIVALKVASGNC